MCDNCGADVDFLSLQCAACHHTTFSYSEPEESTSYVLQEKELSSNFRRDTSSRNNSKSRDIPIANRTASQNLEVVESLLSHLAGTKKYKRAISGGEFAAFSIIGTNDWEDYASLSIDALQLLTLAQINENLEAIRATLEGK